MIRTAIPVEIRFDMERVKHWLSVGAQPSDTVSELLQVVEKAQAWRRQGVSSPRMSKDHPELQELVEYLAEELVDAPDEVTVEEMEEDGAAVFELTVAEEDLGKVIGKQGRTARAFRTILSAAASKVRARALLEILE